MKHFFVCMLFSMLALCATAQPSDSYLMGIMNNGKMKGASFVAVKEGKRIYHRNLGLANLSNNQPVDDQTIFMQASVSKTMIATAIMQLWEKGRINLDIDVNHYLPFSVRTPSFPNDSITARMLLTHTAAIQDEWNTMGALYVIGDSPVSLDSFMKNYLVPTGIFYSAANFYSYPPGTQYNYSNIGSTLAAYLVERITGDPFSHYCDTAIFQKICMNSTSFLLSGISDTTRIARPYTYYNGAYLDAGLYGYPDYPDGQLRTTATDLARFMTMYLQYGSYEGSRVLDSATVAYILQQQTTVDPTQGIIFYQATAGNGDYLWGHNGGDAGVNTALYFNPVKKTGAIALTNGDGTSAANADIMVNALYTWAVNATPSATDTFPPCLSTTLPALPALTREIEVFPNPTTGSFFVNVPSSGVIHIYDLQGKMIMNTSLPVGKTELSLPQSCSPGLYMINFTDKSGVRMSSRLQYQKR